MGGRSEAATGFWLWRGVCLGPVRDAGVLVGVGGLRRKNLMFSSSCLMNCQRSENAGRLIILVNLKVPSSHYVNC